MYTVTHKGISVNSNNISGKSSKPLEKDTKFECLQLTPLLLLDIAELGVQHMQCEHMTTSVGKGEWKLTN